MDDAAGITGVGDLGCKLVGQAETPFGKAEQHDAAIRCQTAAVEGGGEFLATDAWQAEGPQSILAHGGRGGLRLVATLGLDTQSVNAIRSLRDARQPSPAMPVNKTG